MKLGSSRLTSNSWCLGFRGGDLVVGHFVVLVNPGGQGEAVTHVVWAEFYSCMLCLDRRCALSLSGLTMFATDAFATTMINGCFDSSNSSNEHADDAVKID